MPPETASAILAAVRRRWRFADDVEITLEANPNSAEAGKFAAFAAAGINRLSIGVQSFDADVLKVLGRAHEDRKSVGTGKSVAVRVDLGGRRTLKKKIHTDE